MIAAGTSGKSARISLSPVTGAAEGGGRKEEEERMVLSKLG